MKNRKIKIIIILSLVIVLSFNTILPVSAAPLAGNLHYSHSWTQSYGPGTAMSTHHYQYAEYDGTSWILYLANMSGTKYWNNYKNQNSTIQQVTYGISKSHTQSKTYSYKKTVDLGEITIPFLNKLAEAVGGDFTYSKYYAQTEGTSSAYVLNTESKNGYYAVCHCVSADRYDTTYKKSGPGIKSTSTGKWYRYTTTNGYEAIRYSTMPF